MAQPKCLPILPQALENLRNPYPGEAGQRNNFRGDGYFGVDAGLSKSWKIGEHSGLRFAWEVFNVSNSVRFDVNPLTSLQNMTTSGEFGVYGATLTSRECSSSLCATRSKPGSKPSLLRVTPEWVCLRVDAPCLC